MTHDPSNSQPMAKNPAPRRKSGTPRRKTPASDPPRHAPVDAAQAFIAAHQTLVKEPSGETHFEIKLSANPADWHYEAKTSIGKPFGFDPPNASLRATDLTVRACICEAWPLAHAAWRQALERISDPTMCLSLGAEIISPPAPADRAWVVHLVDFLFTPENGGIYQKSLLLALGDHATRVPIDSKDPGAELTEHIRQVSIRRLQRISP